MQHSTEARWYFEVSWEVCNKVGGINTVVSTKAKSMVNRFGDQFVMIGPDFANQTQNGIFEESDLYASWVQQARQDGFNIRIGRWKIPGQPIVILFEHSNFYSYREGIFSHLWNEYKLDSLTGGWDYIEPAIFGFACGKLIEHFYLHNIDANDGVVAHFHEWMMGAGVLHLKDAAPKIATVFTTHATVLGRCIAGNGLSLYDNMNQFDPEKLAQEFNVAAKHSLEKTAAMYADAFTTVSEITARECETFLHKRPDFITPNGFESSFVPNPADFDAKRSAVKPFLRTLTKALTGHEVDENALFVCKSGRFEFRNKGIDVFIQSLSILNHHPSLERQVIAFIMVPASWNAVNKEMLLRMQTGEAHPEFENQHLTHLIPDYDTNPVIQALHKNDLYNRASDKVKVVYVPVYLDGEDGVFNMPYYDILTGFDFAAFPSYYEPWGYTPLEALAFHLPTLTTQVAGFGDWVSRYEKDLVNDVVYIVNRKDHNEDEAANVIATTLISVAQFSNEEMDAKRQRAGDAASRFSWEAFSSYYFQTFDAALLQSTREHTLWEKEIDSDARLQAEVITTDFHSHSRRLYVLPSLPDNIRKLELLTNNIWSLWQPDVLELFEEIDANLFRKVGGNPVALLEEVEVSKLAALSQNDAFVSKVNTAAARLEAYLSRPFAPNTPLVAYFSMEYGLDKVLKLYSGGLGILAGDYLKVASDENANVVAVGLLYRYGYFNQQITNGGEQVDAYQAQKFTDQPIFPVRNKSGQWLQIRLSYPGREVVAKVWSIRVGKVMLYLLDTDLPENSPEDRSITHHLYGGNWENRLKQEYLLGIGGVMILRDLDIQPDVYHLNEGHAAFAGIERLRFLIQQKHLSFHQAVEVVKASSLFTTHTPVPAGHDAFEESFIRTYFASFPAQMGVDWPTFLWLGKKNPQDPFEKFSMSKLGAHLSQEVNGVSRIHGRVSQEIFAEMWDNMHPKEIHIGYVTNSVHYGTWAHRDTQKFIAKHLSPDLVKQPHLEELWSRIYQVSDQEIWDWRSLLKDNLYRYLRRNVATYSKFKYVSPRFLFEMANNFKPEGLVIGFARRFATYKRANLLFANLERLAAIVNNPEKPVTFLFAGKAHPNDKPGQDLIRQIIEVSKRTEFVGRVVFIENYDMDVAANLVSGVDLWMNTPTRPLEASGTSGMKATLNGVLNFSVLDGWWAEGHREGAGWALDEKARYDNDHYQNELDAELIYETLENEIVPMYYQRNEASLPTLWINRIRKTLADIAPVYTMERMLHDYQNQYYTKLHARGAKMRQNGYEKSIELANWKHHVESHWHELELTELNIQDSGQNNYLESGESFCLTLKLRSGAIAAADLSVEVLFLKPNTNGGQELVQTECCAFIESRDGIHTFGGDFSLKLSGVYEYHIRLRPKHDLLMYAQDFPLVKYV